MSREKLHLNGEDSSGGGNVLTTSLDFVRKINSNFDDKFEGMGYKPVKLDLDTHNTP